MRKSVNFTTSLAAEKEVADPSKADNKTEFKAQNEFG